MNKYLHFFAILTFVENSVQIKDFYNFFQKKMHLVAVKHYMEDLLINYYSLFYSFRFVIL